MGSSLSLSLSASASQPQPLGLSLSASQPQPQPQPLSPSLSAPCQPRPLSLSLSAPASARPLPSRCHCSRWIPWSAFVIRPSAARGLFVTVAVGSSQSRSVRLSAVGASQSRSVRHSRGRFVTVTVGSSQRSQFVAARAYACSDLTQSRNPAAAGGAKQPPITFFDTGGEGGDWTMTQ